MKLPRRAFAILLALVGSLSTAELARAAVDDPFVARGHLRVPGGLEATGGVFFLPSRDEASAVAVGAAHSFKLARLAEIGEVEFRVAADGGRAALSSRFFAAPGRAFHEKGATLADDYLIFSLELRPRGVQVLEPVESPLRKGERVRIVGIPSDGRRAQKEIEGVVSRVLDARVGGAPPAPADLRGWGGAPVLRTASGRVGGMLQAAWPTADTLRVGVGPIAGVTQAMKKPLDAGLGRPFAAFTAAAAAEITASAAKGTGSPTAAGAAQASPNAPPTQASAKAPPAPPPPRTPDPDAPALEVRIEHPSPGAILGDAAGAFVAGRALALGGEMRRFDVMIVLDTSGSTSQPTGVDVDGNGVVGTPRLGVLGGLLDLGSTDPGDSILAAEVAAARRLLSGLDPRTTRVGIVTFAGEPAEQQPGFFGAAPRIHRAAVTEEPLTSDYSRLSKALDRVRARGPRGMTHMAAGVDQATIELLGLTGAASKSVAGSEKVVLFFTDGAPTLPYQGFESDNVRAVLRAAQRASRAGVRIHSFAIGPEALAGPMATVEMASITDGAFTPVRHPGLLIHVIEGVSFANVESVAVRNLTNGEEAHQVRTHADGSWDALVPLATGKNRIQVTAVSNDGQQDTETLVLQYAPGTEGPFLPRELVGKRNQLLEARLVELRRGRIDAERAAAEETRRELALEIEHERAEAAARVESQRKELDLKIEPTETAD